MNHRKIMLQTHSSYHDTNGNIFTSQGSQHGILFGKMYCNKKHVFSLFLCWFSLVYTTVTLHLPYFALHFTLNVRISRKVLTSELIDRGENSEFSKSTKKYQQFVCQVSGKTPKTLLTRPQRQISS